MKYCTKCGAQLEDPRFCWKCGTVFETEEPKKMIPESRTDDDIPKTGNGPRVNMGGTQSGAAGNGPANYGPAASANGFGPKEEVPGGVMAACIIGAIIGVICAIAHVVGALGSLGSMATGISFGRFGMIFGGLVRFFLSGLAAAGFAGIAAISIIAITKWRKKAAGSIVVCEELLCGVSFIAVLLNAVIKIATVQHSFRNDGASGMLVAEVLGLILVAALIFALLSRVDGFRLSSGKGFSAAVQDSFQMVSSLAGADKGVKKEGAKNTSYASAGAGTAPVHSTVHAAAAGGAAVTPPVLEGAFTPLKTDYSIIFIMAMNIVTCGIYSYFLIHRLGKEINLSCAGDGKETPGIGKFILYGIVTCGFYCMWWMYSYCNRLAENAPRYGLNFPENGTTWLVWNLYGYATCGFGYIYALYLILKNTMEINKAYNRTFGGMA